MPLSNGKYRDPIPLIQFLSLNGDGSGTTNAIGNYSGGPLTLYVQPPVGEIYVISEFIGHISDAGKFNQDKYGALAGALSNGIQILAKQDGDTILDLTAGNPIKTNDHYMHLSDMVLQDFGGVADSLRASFKKEHFGIAMRLDGSLNQRLEVIFNDDFIGLIDHHFIIHGYK